MSKIKNIYNLDFKRSVKVLLCRHKNKSYYRREKKFLHLQGDEVYTVCDNCGKILCSQFVKNEHLHIYGTRSYKNS